MPGGLDQPPVVRGEGHALEVGQRADGPVGVVVGLAGALGGVLGDVAGEPGVGDLAVVVGDGLVRGGGDLTKVELGAPPQAQRCPVGPFDVEGGRGRGFLDGVAEALAVEAGRWRVGGPVRAVGAVEADGGVEVDEAAALVLGDLGVGQAGEPCEAASGDAEAGGEGTAEGDGEALSEFPGVGLPEHRGLVERSKERAHLGFVINRARPGTSPWSASRRLSRGAGRRGRVCVGGR
ncbi:hypothetical protein LWC35_15935 [Pseudonocardia kujensis]|nr:hypothetical protein [Pseudonocardia kujensis]MCE0764386.1 hypothetical protein [Pseudonocardia kujensis]